MGEGGWGYVFGDGRVVHFWGWGALLWEIRGCVYVVMDRVRIRLCVWRRVGYVSDEQVGVGTFLWME